MPGAFVVGREDDLDTLDRWPQAPGHGGDRHDSREFGEACGGRLRAGQDLPALRLAVARRIDVPLNERITPAPEEKLPTAAAPTSPAG